MAITSNDIKLMQPERLNEIRDVLLARHKGSEQLEPMIEAFLKYDLLERVILEIDFPRLIFFRKSVCCIL